MTINHKGISVGTSIVLSAIILVVGGLIYLSGRERSSPSSSTAAAGDTADHHGLASSGPTSNLQNLINQAAPDFSLTDHNGVTYSLASLKGKNVVLFFNEGVMCYPACWNQVALFGADDRFKGDDVVALSVVVDSQQEWNEAVRQLPELAQATVVHDNGAKVSSAYGVLTTKSSMHYGQLPGHTYVVIDQNGIIRHVYDDPNMAIHNDQLVEEIAKLS
ncbi:MAG: redoxin domain-containing protein [Candidatus Kerfeldbacteria bacterium]|nr:redoxin domain-containing protein [Candidatus Kerfeldbacteria bacterium]